MNAKLIAVAGMTSLATCRLLSGPVLVVQPPVVVVNPVPVAPAPAVKVEVGVPDNYVWDGNEYVGLVGDQYYYLGPGHVWLTLDAPRLARFHDWERTHADWRTHAIRNLQYRRDVHGRNVPLRDVHAVPAAQAGSVYDHGHDTGGRGHEADDHHDH